jgi:hypothetical protein
MKELPRRVSLVVHELLTLLEHLSSPAVFCGVRVTQFDIGGIVDHPLLRFLFIALMANVTITV